MNQDQEFILFVHMKNSKGIEIMNSNVHAHEIAVEMQVSWNHNSPLI